jgi:phosphoribosylanthranilate isomerase
MRKILNKVTITGADDQTSIQDMEALSKEFPFMEWGILLSGTKTGPKFPDLDWLMKLAEHKFEVPIHLSGHICGSWVRQICQGLWTVRQDTGDLLDVFERLQLNFSPYLRTIKNPEFIRGLQIEPGKQFIFQLHSTSHKLIGECVEAGIDVVPFFDCSGGVGVLPERWKEAKHPYTGYAGGLSPDNLTENLIEIEKVCGPGPIWIDVETRVRNEQNQLDLGLVRKFLETAKPWII